jgi:hypothetical protein
LRSRFFTLDLHMREKANREGEKCPVTHFLRPLLSKESDIFWLDPMCGPMIPAQPSN